jgi:hypothetical protein
MRKYNPVDVVATEAVYLRLRPFMIGHPSLPLFDDGEGCPRCGHHELQGTGTITAKTRVYPLFRCTNCFSFSRGSKCLTTPRAALVQ